MESLRTEGERLGVERPELERRTYTDRDGTLVIALTEESERLWSEYLTALHLANVALTSSSKSV